MVVQKFTEPIMTFMTLRNNKLRDNITELLQEVTNDGRLELSLQTLTGEEQ